MIDVFVYGTLLTGESNHHVVAAYVAAVAPGEVRGAMVDSGNGYPAVVLDPAGSVIPGEWLTVDEEGLRRMDRLEQYRGPGGDNDYERVPVSDASSGRRGWIYVWTDSRGCLPIESGSWRQYVRLNGR